MEKPVLVWIRNDLRLNDNPALYEAVAKSKQVVLLYVYDASSLYYSFPGSASRVWLGRALEYFGERARQKGFGWVLREGKPLDILKVMLRELECQHVFWNRRYEPEYLQEDAEIEELLSQDGISVHTFQGNVLVEPWKLMTKKETPFQVFTPFMQAFRELCPSTTEVPEVQPVVPYTVQHYSLCSHALPLTPRFLDWPKHVLEGWKVGEEGALEMLEAFCLQNLVHYEEKKNFPAAEATSMLSPYLHSGEISPRRVWNMVLAYERKTRRSVGEAFLRELVWREFCNYILYHYPRTQIRPFKESFQVPWRKENKELRAWQEGRTGIPLVDAGMRQLWETGWMHNRVRMICASFLVKHLLHNWREGLGWFWDTLLDADIPCNTFNWQYVTGCGPSAPPFFRIFNPVFQAKLYDPDGMYIKKYIPELKNVSPAYIHAPWEAPMEDLLSWGVRLGENYPWPIVDIDEGRKRAVQAYTTGNISA